MFRLTGHPTSCTFILVQWQFHPFYESSPAEFIHPETIKSLKLTKMYHFLSLPMKQINDIVFVTYKYLKSQIFTQLYYNDSSADLVHSVEYIFPA